YCTKLFKHETIERLGHYFKKVVKQVIADTGLKLRDIEIILAEERHRLLIEFNNTGNDYPADKTIPQLFIEQVAKTPDSIALVGADPRVCPPVRLVGLVPPVRPLNLTYRQLHAQSGHLAASLIEKGVMAGDIAAIMVERSLEMIIGLLGILKTGAAYLPLNPKNPAGRNQYMLKDSGARVLINKSEIRNPKSETNSNETNINDQNKNQNSSNLAYLIYTSGSTGNPKGVPITHANFSPLVHWGYRYMGTTVTDRFLQNLSYFFDWSVWEIFLALTTGAGLYITGEDVLLDGEALVTFITKNKISVLHITPSQFQVLAGVAVKLTSLKHLCIGAEKLTYDLVKRSLEIVPDDCRIYNMYGPTEATIISSVFEIARNNLGEYEKRSSVPIGVPVGNTQLYVLDKYLNICPLHVAGELYIGGERLSPGYINNAELTAEKFIDFHHLSFTIHHSILYRSGDRARWLENGVVEFLGRVDQQVKIRGYRIELGEIENKLLAHERVKAAVVNVRAEMNLCAYVVAEEPVRDEIELQKELKEYLSSRLPGYMVPSFIVLIKKISLTPNGKVDLGALPGPEAVSKAEYIDYIAPQNEVEEKLAVIWSEILGIDQDMISMNANFFELGGHSLKATVLVSRIHKELNVIIALGEIFKAPTIRHMGEYIKNTKNNTQRDIDGHLVLLNEGLPGDNHIFFIHDGRGEIEGYIELCKHLNSDFNHWGIRAAHNSTIHELAETYIESIKKIQPHGPYHIAGWSLGGTIAFEMVAQLEQKGEEIAFLALVDSPPPHKNLVNEAAEFNEKSLNYSHLSKTLLNARALYKPAGKIQKPVHYIAAGQSRGFKKEHWQRYCAAEINYYETPGDHFSILKLPQVIELAKIFSKILKRT
ncbi:MAG TPA: amino acid adenylation domain-containing protein, partial [Candidatus Deferrimicrobium sp.]|nr:amino acid adenylation domain-containing protein [Candidatus Deferrimicrobium sp.]